MIKTCEICGGQYAASLDDVYTEAGCKCSELQRENKRYREALERIVKCCTSSHSIAETIICRIACESLSTDIRALTDDERKAAEKHWRERGHGV